MQTLDFAPLYRATVGFDRIADLMDRVLTADVAQPTYPPYNIEKTAEDSYRISIAVAGFTPDELSVEVKEGALYVSARRAGEETEKTYLHRGIATRAFERRFALADHVRVTGASHENGLLQHRSGARDARSAEAAPDRDRPVDRPARQAGAGEEEGRRLIRLSDLSKAKTQKAPGETPGPFHFSCPLCGQS